MCNGSHSPAPSGSRTQVSGVGGGHANKEAKVKAAAASASLEIKGMRFNLHSTLLAGLCYTCTDLNSCGAAFFVTSANLRH